MPISEVLDGLFHIDSLMWCKSSLILFLITGNHMVMTIQNNKERKGARARVAVEYVDKMSRPNQRSKIGPQYDQVYISHDQEQALSSK